MRQLFRRDQRPEAALPRKSDPSRWWGTRAWSRHGLVLVVAGTVYILIGYSYLTAPATKARESSLRLALEYLPLHTWGIVFIAVGVLAIISARWPPSSETWGYTTLTGLSAAWAAFYGLGVALGAPVINVSGLLVWSLMAFMWWAISGLVNPVAKPRKAVPRQ